ncbi:MAG: helix-turn-helix transcriptional regulator [Telluria sp.]
MSRGSRLLQLLDALRARRQPVTAAVLAAEMGVSERTIYRDIQALAAMGTPVEGEAGIGYVLKPGTFLPPLSFTVDEIEALVLGARWVRHQGDDELARAAEAVLAKVATATPRDLRARMDATSLWVPAFGDVPKDRWVAPTRAAIRDERKLRIAYLGERGDLSERTVWPFALAFLEGKRLLAAWCELRGGFRHFRIDRIQALRTLDEPYQIRRAELLNTWRRDNGIPPS